MPNIGEGTYGCVYKPPIKCDDKFGLKKEDYKHKVSKILTTRAAKAEMAELAKVDKIDIKHKYSLESPVMCDPDAKDAQSKLKKYSCKPAKKYANEPFSLLLSDYGGKDLHEYCDNDANSALSTRKFNSFWKNAITLFEGIQDFLAHDFVHRDVKPSNILIKPSGKMVFIDFGLSENIQDYIKNIVNKHIPKFHWSYPIEYAYFSVPKEDIEDIDTATDKERAYMALNVYKSGALTSGFQMLENRLQPYKGITYIEHILSGIEQIPVYKNDIPHMIDMSLRSFDTYGMGLTLNFMLNCFYDSGYKMSEQFYKSMHGFCMSLCHPNLALRLKNIKEVITIYKTILKENGINIKSKSTKTVKHNGSSSAKTVKRVKSIREIVIPNP